MAWLKLSRTWDEKIRSFKTWLEFNSNWVELSGVKLNSTQLISSSKFCYKLLILKIPSNIYIFLIVVRDNERKWVRARLAREFNRLQGRTRENMGNKLSHEVQHERVMFAHHICL